jgi:ferredoxin/flavodoxin---NADP+ reductase
VSEDLRPWPRPPRITVGGVFEVLTAEWLAPGVKRFRVAAPRVAKHWRAGQFVIVRPDVDGERIPLTIAEGDADEGWIGLIVQSVGASTIAINALESGDAFADLQGRWAGHPRSSPWERWW